MNGFYAPLYKKQTIQVLEPFGEGMILRKQFRYKPDDLMSKKEALDKAIDFANKAKKTSIKTSKN